MGSALTSWKEIANYLGKGVRSVQRWEADGFPVRRPNANKHGIVMAFSDEIDAWIKARDGKVTIAQHLPLRHVVLECRESIDANRNLRYRRDVLLGEMHEQRLRLHSQLDKLAASCAKIRRDVLLPHRRSNLIRQD